MADTPETKEAGGMEVPSHQLIIHAQYVRDLSFENPKAPDSLRAGHDTLNVDVSFNIAARPVPIAEGERHFEVALKLAATARRENEIVYLGEVEYGCVVSLPGAGDEFIHPILHIEVPRLLFPFARQKLIDLIIAGGHPPLPLPPIDFTAFYEQQRQQAKNAAEATNH